MNNDIDGDEAMKNFEDLGRKLFQKPKPDEAKITEDDDDTTPPDED